MKKQKVNIEKVKKLIKNNPDEIDFILSALFDKLRNPSGYNYSESFIKQQSENALQTILREKPFCISYEGQPMYFGDTIYHVEIKRNDVCKILGEAFSKYDKQIQGFENWKFHDYSKGVRNDYGGGTSLVFSKRKNAEKLIKENKKYNDKIRIKEVEAKNKEEKAKKLAKYIELKKEFESA